MKKQIFKYSRSVSESIHDRYWHISEDKRFFPDTPLCPYCTKGINNTYSNSRKNESPPEDIHEWWRDEESINVYQCPDCGWWYLESRTDHENNDSDDFRWSAIGYQRAIFDVYNIDCPKVPIDALSLEISKRGDNIFQIHHRAMERLVEGVMREHYPGCEVELCGRSGDKGIDLFIILAEKTIGVQVKRRMSPGKTESVSTVREFFGAGVANSLRDLVFVSTADRYTNSSSGAKDFAKEVVDKKIIDSFTLIDRDRFLSMLNLIVEKPIEDPWREHVW